MVLRRVGVVGAGTMGMGIAEWLASSGFAVTLRSGRPETLEGFTRSVRKFYDRRVKRGRVTAERRDEIVGSTRTTGGYEEFADADLVIENVLEDLPTKAACFEALHAVCPERTVFATNTSSLSITALAERSGRPDRFLGMHFFQPARFVKLVEVIPTATTPAEVVDLALGLCRDGGKAPIRVADRPGFLVNRLLGVTLLEAVRLVEAGCAPVRVDKAMTDRGMMIGPCRVADLIGLDLLLTVNRVLERHDPAKYRVSPLHETLVASGALGRRAGRGIYVYGAKGEPTGVSDAVAGPAGKDGDTRGVEVLADRMILALLNEAWLCVEEGVARAEDIDPALKEVLGMPKGPMELTESMGRSVLAERLEAFADEHGERFRPAGILGSGEEIIQIGISTIPSPLAGEG